MDLRAHLEHRYGVEVGALSRLDDQVWRVHRRDGPDWVARVFAPPRLAADAEGDAQVLRALAAAGFPAERCADPEPVSVLGDRTVLVTAFVDGVPARGRRPLVVLGALLGALQSRPTASRRPGGAWHHLAPRGGPEDEVAAATALLDARRADAPDREMQRWDALRAAVAELDTCAGLPLALVHPDFVPDNAVTTPDGGTVVVDWANAGRGPRLWPVAFLLWATGARHPQAVDQVVAAYRRRADLQPEELDRLAAVMRARPLLLDCWSVCHDRTSLDDAVGDLAHVRAAADSIAARARAAFSDGRAVPRRP